MTDVSKWLRKTTGLWLGALVLLSLLNAGGDATVPTAAAQVLPTPAETWERLDDHPARGAGDLSLPALPLFRPALHREQLCVPDRSYDLRDGQRVVPILLYHFIGRESLEQHGHSTSRFNVTAEDFEAQLQLLHSMGYQTVTVGEIARALDGEGDLPARPIALTFDDGWVEHYSVVLPLLRRYGMRATFYISTRYTGGNRFVTWEQLGEMVAAGMEIGSHTRTHVNLSAAGQETAWYEIWQSRLDLEQRLDVTVETFAYPFGAYNSSVVSLVSQAGYRAAVSIGSSPVQGIHKRFALTRVEITGSDTLSSFARHLPWMGSGTFFCRPPRLIQGLLWGWATFPF